MGHAGSMPGHRQENRLHFRAASSLLARFLQKIPPDPCKAKNFSQAVQHFNLILGPFEIEKQFYFPARQETDSSGIQNPLTRTVRLILSI